jgi:hypothetical protein
MSFRLYVMCTIPWMIDRYRTLSSKDIFVTRIRQLLLGETDFILLKCLVRSMAYIILHLKRLCSRLSLFLNFIHLVDSCTDYNQIHGERYVGPVVAIFMTMGLQQCIKECLARPAVCGGVNYRQKQLLCEIVTTTDTAEHWTECIRIGLNCVSISEVIIFYVCKIQSHSVFREHMSFLSFNRYAVAY